jgi:hypothetical protein
MTASRITKYAVLFDSFMCCRRTNMLAKTSAELKATL